jgi:phytoene dehydrogenase-like protein
MAEARAVGTVHVVGAGIAGLACAVRLAQQGRHVRLYEAAGQAGGRCRSYYDSRLERTIDNGNHILLTANREALSYVEEIGAAESLAGPAHAAFPFVDLQTGDRWTLRPGRGPVPW